jgi:hypothetical protein
VHQPLPREAGLQAFLRHLVVQDHDASGPLFKPAQLKATNAGPGNAGNDGAAVHLHQDCFAKQAADGQARRKVETGHGKEGNTIVTAEGKEPPGDAEGVEDGGRTRARVAGEDFDGHPGIIHPVPHRGHGWSPLAENAYSITTTDKFGSDALGVHFRTTHDWRVGAGNDRQT